MARMPKEGRQVMHTRILALIAAAAPLALLAWLGAGTDSAETTETTPTARGVGDCSQDDVLIGLDCVSLD
jgi:hypothetical protein